MFSKIKEFLFGKPVETQAPYKVEAPIIIAAGEPPATVVVVEGVVEGAGKVEVPVAAPVETTAAKKPAGRKPAGEKKPKAAAMKATAKKAGRKPKSKT